MRIRLAQFFSNQAGATAIEYGLLAALMSVVIITAMTSMGTTVNSTLASIATSLR